MVRDLQNFLSRAHWRSHFIQKLETEPQIEGTASPCTNFLHKREQKHGALEAARDERIIWEMWWACSRAPLFLRRLRVLLRIRLKVLN